MRDIRWDAAAWQDYCAWQAEDWAIVAKINALLAECQRHPFTGTGKPEPRCTTTLCLVSRWTMYHQAVLGLALNDAVQK